MNSFDLIAQGLNALPKSGRVQWHEIEPLVDKTFNQWLTLSRLSYAPPTYVCATENGIVYSWDAKKVQKYLDNPRAYRASAVPFNQLRSMWAGVFYDGYILNAKNRKQLRLYVYRRNPKQAAIAFERGYIIRRPDIC